MAMDMETFYFKTEDEANKARRRWIEAGYSVSLIGFSSNDNRYVFDVYGTKGR